MTVLPQRAPRSPWNPGFPDALLHAPEDQVLSHVHYAAAKGGDVQRAAMLVEACHDADVLGATVLTGKLHSAKLVLSDTTLLELRSKHGPELETWWADRFGHTFDCLTESEARYLSRTKNAERIRTRIAAEEQA